MTSITGTNTEALDTFCRAHWYRLYAVACRRGCAPSDAEDAVQELFLNLTRRGHLDDLMLRSEEAQLSYLSMRLRCLLMNRWRDARRQGRGGEMSLFSQNDEGTPEPACHETPATHHDRVWLLHCIDDAVSRLHLQTRPQTWRQISPVLFDDQAAPQNGALRAALHRARKKLRGLVREEMNGSFNEWHVGAV
jgi:DNA-directed RNA polymerase specialized sigma24 family protein